MKSLYQKAASCICRGGVLYFCHTGRKGLQEWYCLLYGRTKEVMRVTNVDLLNILIAIAGLLLSVVALCQSNKR